MLILGLNAYHGDSSACLVEDGAVISAAEEERFTRKKHWAGFPRHAIEFCLSQRKARLNDVDVVAVNRDPRANLLKKIGFVLKNRPDLKLIVDRLKNARSVRSVSDELEQAFPGQTFRGHVEDVEHHTAHLASAFLCSPFDRAAVVSVDGFGDFASAAWALGEGTKLDLDGRVLFPHSLGIFYSALTQFLGFPHYGDEYKVMGLAPYGEPRFVDQLRKIVHLERNGGFSLDVGYFRHVKEKVAYEWDNGVPSVSCLYTPKLEELLGPARAKGDELEQRHKDLARSTQAMYEEAFFHLLNTLQPQYGIGNIALAGGCAMNSVANGKIARNTQFNRVYVHPAAGDAGGAVGAALWTWHKQRPSPRSFRMEHAFWGPEFTDDEIAELISAQKDEFDAANCSITRHDDHHEVIRKTAEAIADGKVIGWFQGRMEWGPRALGNRSILADPRRADMKDILNLKVKRRESFRPFAPSVLREKVLEWFEEDAEVPFMMKVFQIREDKREQIPAVTHVDGSGRLQTVTPAANPRYHELISAFDALTGVPMVLNTSFNENEPVVCHPNEAIACFLRTRMDVLVLNNHFILRDGS